jgi:hypothetical protein
MSNKVKKQTSSLPFSLSRWFNRISTMQPSSLLVTGVIIGVSVLLFSGIVYNIVNQPLIVFSTQDRFYFFYTSIFGSSGLSEHIRIRHSYCCNTVRYRLHWPASSIPKLKARIYTTRQAYMVLIIGVALVFISYLFLEYVIFVKMTG